MRKLSFARVAAVGFGTLALLVLMLLAAHGTVAGGAENPVLPVAVTRSSVADGQMPVGPLEDAPTPADQLLAPGARPRVDLEGDEVSPALATYGINREGNLYEVHSPQTEEPKLGSPIG